MKRLFLLFVIPLFCVPITVPAAALADSTVNYDTAWTYVYDGGKFAGNLPTPDIFYDLKSFSNGISICVGETRDTTGMRNLILAKFDGAGKLFWKKLYWFAEGSGGRSIVLAKNKDFIIGGFRYVNPLILRTDTLGNIKSSTWLYDSVNNKQLYLSRGATVNCVRETSRGTIICAAGDYFTDVGYVFGSTKNDYAAILLLDSAGKVIHWGQAGGQAGYASGGFDIEETTTGNFILSGNQSILYADTTIHQVWEKKYTFSLNGVGSEVNNVIKCKMLRDGSLMVAGQAYEGNCWTKYKHLYYDAWWSPIAYAYGTNATWDTAGYQGGDDQIYDFTQLVNGNLVFVGKKYYTGFGGGLWTFVTDSTGKNLLWEKVTPVPYKTDDGYNAYPMSVCATPDSGFTIAGYLQLSDSLGGYNALAAHFAPNPISAIIVSPASSAAGFALRSKNVGTRVIFSLSKPIFSSTGLTVYSAAGKVVATVMPGKSDGSLVWDYSKIGKGVYIYKINLGNHIIVGKMIIDR